MKSFAMIPVYHAPGCDCNACRRRAVRQQLPPPGADPDARRRNRHHAAPPAGAGRPGNTFGWRLPLRKELPCVHVGPPTGAKTACGTCGDPKATAEVRACGVHGTCTTDRRAKDDRAWCLGCPDYCPPPAGWFDRVVLVNLDRRPDRLAAFEDRMASAGWPFAAPDRFAAVDGTVARKPDWFHGPSGAWGCRESHITVVRRAIADGVRAVLVFEDDAVWGPDLSAGVRAFLTAVPADWDVLMFGGEHMTPPKPVKPGIVRCRNTQRTHAYAVRAAAMPALVSAWEAAKSHIDHASGPLLGSLNAYAPEKFLVGQAAGESDIMRRPERERWWA